MSTRYVWGQYTIEIEQMPVTKYEAYSTTKTNTFSYDLVSSNNYQWRMGSSWSFNEYTGKFSATGVKTYTGGSGTTGDNFGPGYIECSVKDDDLGIQMVYSSGWVSRDNWFAGNGYCIESQDGWKGYYPKSYQDYEQYESRGNLVGYVSAASQSNYPSNSTYNGYWYYKQGSDNIDATKVTIPSAIKGGEDITVEITPSSSKRYEGEVTYIIEYDFGSGWESYGENSNTSLVINVPLGSSYAQVRVKAKDNLGFTSTTYTTSNQASVNNNDPPTAPGYVTASNVYADQVATITITEATDPNGEVVNYEWQRSVDGGAYSTIQTTDADTLSIKDNIGADWGTVAYRVRAKDDYGEWGPYATSETYTINENWLTIAAPSYSLGMQTSPFYYTFSVGITGNPVTTNGIHAIIYLDNRQIQEETDLERDEAVSVPIDPRLLGASTHTILVIASKEGYTTAEQSSDFYIEGISAPAGGIIEQLQNSAGQAVIPYTLGQAVIGRDGKDINTVIEEVEGNSLKIESGSYSGNGTYGSYNPNTLMTSFEAKMMILSDSTGSTTLTWVGSPTVGNITVNSTTSQISWYANSAANQFNTSGQTYYYTIIG